MYAYRYACLLTCFVDFFCARLFHTPLYRLFYLLSIHFVRFFAWMRDLAVDHDDIAIFSVPYSSFLETKSRNSCCWSMTKKTKQQVYTAFASSLSLCCLLKNMEWYRSYYSVVLFSLKMSALLFATFYPNWPCIKWLEDLTWHAYMHLFMSWW